MEEIEPTTSFDAGPSSKFMAQLKILGAQAADPKDTHNASIGLGETDDLKSFPSIPGYRIQRLLGQGGMGVVYLAIQESLNRPVALKVIRRRKYDPEKIKLFRDEANILAQFSHPNIVDIYDCQIGGNQETISYIAFEYVEGGTLAKSLETQAFNAREAAELTEILARAIQKAHEKKIAHLDLKPENILLQPIERVTGNTARIYSSVEQRLGIPKIADFGLGRQIVDDTEQATAGAIRGTPEYMAPEQAAGNDQLIGPASDIYSLGAILYCLLAGRPPIVRRDSLMETLALIQSTTISKPNSASVSIHKNLETICMRCLEREPQQRFASARDLADDLRRFLNHEPIQSRPVNWLVRQKLQVQRNPLVAGLMAAIGIIIIVLGIGSYQFAKDQQEKRLAEQRQKDVENRAQVIDEENKVERQKAQEFLSQYFAEEDKTGWKAERNSTRYDKVVQLRAQFISLIERMPENDSLRLDLARIHHRIGLMDATFERLEKARDSIQQALALMQFLVERHPTSIEYRFEYAHISYSVAMLSRLQLNISEADWQESLVNYRRAINTMTELMTENPEVKQFRSDLVIMKIVLAQQLDIKGQIDEALIHSEAAELQSQHQKVNRVARLTVVTHRGLLLAKKSGPSAKAVALLNECLDHMRSIVERQFLRNSIYDSLKANDVKVVAFDDEPDRYTSYNLGHIIPLHQFQDLYARKIAVYEQWIKDHPGDRVAKRYLIFAYRYAAFSKLVPDWNKYQAPANKLYDEMIAAEPNDFGLLWDKAIAELITGVLVTSTEHHFDRIPMLTNSIEMLHHLERIEPKNAQVKRLLSQAYHFRSARLMFTSKNAGALRDGLKVMEYEPYQNERYHDIVQRNIFLGRKDMVVLGKAGKFTEAIEIAKEIGKCRFSAAESNYDIACVYGMAASRAATALGAYHYAAQGLAHLQHACELGFHRDSFQGALSIDKNDPVGFIDKDTDLEYVRLLSGYRPVIERFKAALAAQPKPK